MLNLTAASAIGNISKTEYLRLDLVTDYKQLPPRKKDVTYTIEGKVILEKDTFELEYTTIRIKETGQVFQTDSSGIFKIGLTRDRKIKKITLSFSHRGYNVVERTICMKQLPVTNMSVYLYKYVEINDHPVLPELK